MEGATFMGAIKTRKVFQASLLPNYHLQILWVHLKILSQEELSALEHSLIKLNNTIANKLVSSRYQYFQTK